MHFSWTYFSRFLFYLSSAFCFITLCLFPHSLQRVSTCSYRSILYCSCLGTALVFVTASMFRSSESSTLASSLLLSGSVVYGIGGTLLLILLKTDIARLTHMYASVQHSQRDVSSYLVASFSMFYALFYSSLIWRSTITLTVLTLYDEKNNSTQSKTSANCEIRYTKDDNIFAVSSFMGKHTVTSTDTKSHSNEFLVQAIFGVFLTVCFAALLLTYLFVPGIEESMEHLSNECKQEDPLTTSRQR